MLFSPIIPALVVTAQDRYLSAASEIPRFATILSGSLTTCCTGIRSHFDRQCFPIKIIHHFEGPETSFTLHRIVDKMMDQLWIIVAGDALETGLRRQTLLSSYSENSVSAGSKSGVRIYGTRRYPTCESP